MQEQKGETGYKTKNSFLNIEKPPKFYLKTKKTYLAFLRRISLQKRLTKPQKETTIEIVNEHLFFYKKGISLRLTIGRKSGAATMKGEQYETNNTIL